MKILNLMNKKKLTAQGSITVFMTFIFMIILSLILDIFENTRIISSTGYMKNASLSAEKTLFGDYNLELYKEYGLFGYGGYNGIDYDDMCQEFREIVKKNLCVKPENALLTYTDIYKIKNITVKTEKSQGFKDGDNWDRQIKACLVSDTVDEIADKIKNKHSEDGTYDEKEVYKKLDDADSYETGKYKEKYADKNEKGSEEKQGKTEIENSDKDGNKSEKNDKTEAKKDKADEKRNDMEDADIGNPLEMFKELVQNGYLSLVCDISEVSNENIEKALATATAIAGITGIEPVIKGVQYAIIAILAFEESCIDTAALLDGKKIPLLKNTTDIKIKYEEICTVSGSFFREKARQYQESDGKITANFIDYREYLFAFLAVVPEEKIKSRLFDIIQHDLRTRYNESFRIHDCIVAADYNITYSMKFAFPFLWNMYGKDLKYKKFRRQVSVSYRYG